MQSLSGMWCIPTYKVVQGWSDPGLGVVQVDRPQDGALGLEGHSAEVTGVAWCPSDFGRIATCGDDASVRLWALQRGGPGKKAVAP